MPSGSNVVLHGPERFVQDRPEHFLHEGTAHQAVAVLARQRTAELEHEVGDVVGDRLERLHAFVGLHVHHGPNVEASDRRMRIDAGGRLVPFHDLQESLDVVAEFFGGDRGVLDERERLGVALHRHRQSQRCLAETPDAGLIGGGNRAPPSTAIAEPAAARLRAHRAEAPTPRQYRRRTPRTTTPRRRPAMMLRRSASSAALSRA